MSAKTCRRSNKGLTSIMAMLFLAIFATIAVAFFSETSMTVVKASNIHAAGEARQAAESGMSFVTYKAQRCGVSGSLRGAALIDALAAKLKTALNGTDNLGGAAVTYAASTITIPPIALDGGKSFTAQITLPAADTLRVTITGSYTGGASSGSGAVQRQVVMDFHPAWEQALGYGLCSQGPVSLGMNTDLTGLVTASDGSVFSAAPSVAVDCGSGHISGDVSVSNPTATLSLGGTRVDGVIRYNAPPVAMPVIDRSPYRNLATTVVDSTTNVSSGTFKNIRIKAGTNPSFGGVTIQGIMYVESPNHIYFNNGVNFTGVMVADDPAAGSLDTDNYIYFKNSMTFNGPEALPDTSEFSQVRALKGAAVLCPGFTMEFKNNMTSVGGIMALKALTAKNNVDSTLYGSMLIYGSAGLDFKNNTDLTVNLSNTSSPPPGFKGYGLPPLQADPGTYVEK